MYQESHTDTLNDVSQFVFNVGHGTEEVIDTIIVEPGLTASKFKSIAKICYTITIDDDGEAKTVMGEQDVANATWTNTIGEPELIAVWTDPDVPMTTQERFYTSPIWYTPRNGYSYETILSE